MITRAIRLIATGAPLEERRVELGDLQSHGALVRVRAAGICRSDLHYRSGASPVGPLPLTPGHEIAGTLEAAGADAIPVLEQRGIGVGSRVAVHYLISCGHCRACMAGHEQFCTSGRMIGKHIDGGFADYVIVPARNLVAVPDAVPTEAAAVAMCSTATALHALHKAELAAGDSVAVFGIGGLGMSAIQLARAMGALRVYAIDIDADRLSRAERLGAIPINVGRLDPVEALREETGGGVDCALELLGLPVTIDQAIRSLAPLGRVAIAGIAEERVAVDTYRDVIGKEAKIVGVSDHTRSEVEYALELAASGALALDQVVTRRLPLDAAAINGALDALAGYGPGVRSVVVPESPSTPA